tara:strand:+ start:112 stop:432 length:321 start_codon:yes stop_codon:yes gene_type:complete
LYKKITPREFSDIRSKKNNWQLLDVREKEEIEIAKLPKSIFIPMNDVKSRIDELNKNEPIAVICRSGIRSAEIAKFLVSRSFTDVANIEGGINKWSDTVDKRIKKY